MIGVGPPTSGALAPLPVAGRLLSRRRSMRCVEAMPPPSDRQNSCRCTSLRHSSATLLGRPSAPPLMRAHHFGAQASPARARARRCRSMGVPPWLQLRSARLRRHWWASRTCGPVLRAGRCRRRRCRLARRPPWTIGIGLSMLGASARPAGSFPRRPTLPLALTAQGRRVMRTSQRRVAAASRRKLANASCSLEESHARPPGTSCGATSSAHAAKSPK
mmetsp:Transcript_42057/g.122002  ORF Transcript_42057/g.122002 Transcript_42057/m.122002 type:complete len:218 (+) Transcript_42057:676-1329(+)